MNDDKQILVDYCRRFIGVPYIYGGNNPVMGFDCSGFVCEILRAFGEIDRHDLAAQNLHDLLVSTCPKEMGVGSVLFFGNNEATIDHVAIAISESLMIEAGGGNRYTKSTAAAAASNAFVRIRPILSRRDLVSFLLPNYKNI